MKRIWAVLFLGLVFIPRPACGEEKKAVLTGDSLFYDYEQKQVVAQGNVEATYEKMKICADSITLYQEENYLVAQGSVTVDDGGDLIKADVFVYDFNKEAGLVYPFSARIRGDGLKAPLLLNGAGMTFDGDSYFIDRTRITSCDRERPHYVLEALKVVFYPGDRLILYSIFYKEGSVPLFYWPFISINLNDEKSHLEMPRVGKDEQGWFVIFAYLYYISAKNGGDVKLKYSETLGLDVGVEHTYKPADSLATIWSFSYGDYQPWEAGLEIAGNPFWPGWQGKIKVNGIYDPSELNCLYKANIFGQLQGKVGETNARFGVNANYQDGAFINYTWNTAWSNCRIGRNVLSWDLSMLQEDAINRINYKYDWSVQRGWEKFNFRWGESHSLDEWGKMILKDSYFSYFSGPGFTVNWVNSYDDTFVDANNFNYLSRRDFRTDSVWHQNNRVRIAYYRGYQMIREPLKYQEQFNSREPDLTYTRENIKLGWWGTFNFNLGASRNEEFKITDTTTETGTTHTDERVDLDTCYTGIKRNKQETKLWTFTFSWEPEWQAGLYSTGDKSWWWKNIYGLKWQFIPHWETNFTANTKQSGGKNPLLSNVPKEGKLNWNLLYSFDDISMVMATGREWRMDIVDPLTFELKAGSKEDHQIVLNTSYLLEFDPVRDAGLKHRWRSIRLSWNRRYEPGAVDLGVGYSGFWDAWDVRLNFDWRLTEKWRVKYNMYRSFYDLNANRRNAVSLYYTWHCREIEVNYDSLEDTYTMSMQILAF
ncbi:MAG: LptA/OstA family protein [Bacillota bacterium]